MQHPTLEIATDSCNTSQTHWGSQTLHSRETEKIFLAVMSRLQHKQPIAVTCPSHQVNNIMGRGRREREREKTQTREMQKTNSERGGCVEDRKPGLTVKPMPTVEVKDPGMNLPWSYWTSREVLPTPLSPTRIVYRGSHRRGGSCMQAPLLPEARPLSGFTLYVTVHVAQCSVMSSDSWRLA